MVKLAFVIHSLQPGGMERVMSQLVNNLAQDPGIEVHLIMYGIRIEMFYDIDEKVIVHKAPACTFDSRLLLIFKRALYLRKMISRIKPYSILSFGEYWNSFVLLSLIFTKNRIYVSDRCQPDKYLGPVHNIVRTLLYRRAKGIVAQTDKAKDILTSQFPHASIRVIGNPIRNIQCVSDLMRDKVILTVGRLIESKHHDHLIRIFADLPTNDWKLIIIGADALKQKNRQKLQDLIEESGLTDKVVLAGNRSDVDMYYCSSSIFAFTSSSEGFPNVIGEAMSAGLPVVAYDCIAGPSDMITDGISGYLVKLYDEVAFSARLKELMGSGKLRNEMGKKAQSAICKFSVDAICIMYKQMLLEN